MPVHGCLTYPCPICMTTTTGAVATWNGGSCGVCGALYLGSHVCSVEDLLRRAAELTELARQRFDQTAEQGQPVDVRFDRSRSCPCRPENGGSGVCGCTLSGPQVTC